MWLGQAIMERFLGKELGVFWRILQKSHGRGIRRIILECGRCALVLQSMELVENACSRALFRQYLVEQLEDLRALSVSVGREKDYIEVRRR